MLLLQSTLNIVNNNPDDTLYGIILPGMYSPRWRIFVEDAGKAYGLDWKRRLWTGTCCEEQLILIPI